MKPNCGLTCIDPIQQCLSRSYTLSSEQSGTSGPSWDERRCPSYNARAACETNFTSHTHHVPRFGRDPILHQGDGQSQGILQGEPQSSKSWRNCMSGCAHAILHRCKTSTSSQLSHHEERQQVPRVMLGGNMTLLL